MGGALVEVEEVGGTVPGPGAELGSVEGLAEAVGGLALEGAGGVDVGDLVGEAVREAKVVDGDGGLGGDDGDEVFAGGGEAVDVGMAVEEAAEAVAGAAADGDGKIAANGRVIGRERGEGEAFGKAGVEVDVGRADGELLRKLSLGISVQWGSGKLAKMFRSGPASSVEAVGLIVDVYVVVKEGAVAGATEMQAGVEGGPGR